MKKFILVIIIAGLFFVSPIKASAENNQSSAPEIGTLSITADDDTYNYSSLPAINVKEKLILEGNITPDSEIEFRTVPKSILIETQTNSKGDFKIIVPLDELERGEYTGEVIYKEKGTENKTIIFQFVFNIPRGVDIAIPNPESSFTNSIAKFLAENAAILLISLGISLLTAALLLVTFLILRKKHPKVFIDRSINKINTATEVSAAEENTPGKKGPTATK